MSDWVASAVDAMARELLGRGEPIRFVARGASMRPFVRDGDRVTVGPLDGPPRPGDVVLVAAGPALGLVHRVLWRARDGRVYTKGDALPRGDGWHPPTAVLGRVTAVERGGRPVPLRRRRALLASLARLAAVSLQRRLPKARLTPTGSGRPG